LQKETNMAIKILEPNTEHVIRHSLNNVHNSMSTLKNKILLEDSLKHNCKMGYSDGLYHFDFYFEKLRLGIQIDALSYAYSDMYNGDQPKVMSVGHKNIKVLKISDYQVLVDSDEIIRFIKNYSN